MHVSISDWVAAAGGIVGSRFGLPLFRPSLKESEKQKSILLRTGVVTACLFAASAVTAAEPIAHTHYRAKQVLGTKILIAGDSAVGTVDDLVFDDAGNLEYLIVENGGKLFTVPFEAAKFNLEKRMAVLSLTAEQYQVIPTYTVTSSSNPFQGVLEAVFTSASEK